MRVPAHAAVVRDRRRRPRRDRPGGRGLRQRGAAPGRRAGPRRAGSRPWSPRTPTPTPGSPSTTSHPAWIVRAFRDALAFAGREPGELPALLAADNAAPAVTLAALPGLATAAELAAGQGTRGPWRRPPSGSRVLRTRCRPCGRAGPGCRTRAVSWSRSRWRPRPCRGTTVAAGSTCARGRAARRPCSAPSWPGGSGPAGRFSWRTRSRRTGPSSSAGRSRRSSAPRPGSSTSGWATGGRWGRPSRGGTTGCSSMPPAPGSVRCAAVRRPAGGEHPRTWPRSGRCSATCCARRSTRSARAAWWPT